MYRIALVNDQYKVEVAAEAEATYQKIKAFQPDVILLDIMLPEVSGLEILKELRTNPARGCQDTKIVILTNLAQRSATDNAIQNGADGFIIKADIVPKDLSKVIKSLTEDSGSQN
ncbi:MAG: response regulator [Candidatus Saccharibacteria bacterium]|nr:response regulator [Candidatus Saccharibacteria bacterium]